MSALRMRSSTQPRLRKYAFALQEGNKKQNAKKPVSIVAQHVEAW
jgi:hypothetical protein